MSILLRFSISLLDKMKKQQVPINSKENMRNNHKDYARVSEILHHLYDFKNIDPGVLNAKAELGTHVHEAIDDVIQGDFPVVNQKELGYLSSFEKWFEACSPKYLRTEERFYDDDKKITGQIDGIACLEWFDNPVLVDYKTSVKESPVWKMQAHLYHYLIKKNGVEDIEDRFIFLKLDKNGKSPKVYQYAYDDCVMKECMDLVDKYWKEKSGF